MLPKYIQLYNSISTGKYKIPYCGNTLTRQNSDENKYLTLSSYKERNSEER